MAENRPVLSDPAVLDALAHPVRLDVLGYLMSAGPHTASDCARAVGDTPSNCSYHLRVLASHGLVEPAPDERGGDGRTKPWRATLTGFEFERPGPAGGVGGGGGASAGGDASRGAAAGSAGDAGRATGNAGDPGRATGSAGDAGRAALEGASVQLDYQLAREHLRTRDTLPPEWRDLEFSATYGLLATPSELADLLTRIDAVVRPFIAATRGDAPAEAAHVHLSTMALPRRWGLAQNGGDPTDATPLTP